MSLNRDQRKALKLNTSLPYRVAAELGCRVEAKQTSTSGRWVSLLCEHRANGLPCFDVLNVNTEGRVDRHHFAVVETEGITYDEARDTAKAEARTFYDKVVTLLQTKPSPSLQEEENRGLKIVNPDGSEEDYNFVN